MAQRYEEVAYAPIRNWARGCYLRKGGVVGKIFVGRNVDNGQIFLIKSVPSEPAWSRQLAALRNEEKVLKKLSRRNCPNIYRILGSTTSESVAEFGGKSTMDLFLEFALPQGHLTQHLQREGKLQEPVAKTYTFQILQALACMHKNGIVHRDIKGVNILLCEKEVKVVGFGIAKDTSRPNMCSWLLEPEFCSSPPAIPMHLIEQAIGHPPAEFSEDIRALGCTVCEMVTGGDPMIDTDDPSTVSYNVIRALEEDSTLKTMPSCLNFIKCCLQESDKASTLQWTADRLLDHPWIASLEWRTVTRTMSLPTYESLSSQDGAATSRDTSAFMAGVVPAASPRVSSLTACKDLLCCRSLDTTAVISPTSSQHFTPRPHRKRHTGRLRRFVSMK